MNQRKKVTVPAVRAMKSKARIGMLTAYDYPSAKIADAAGADILLVGDSLGMVILGYPDTLSVTVEDMLHHTRAVVRGAKTSLIVADMPYLSYHVSIEESVRNAGRFVQAGAHAVKVEGAKPSRIQTIEAILDAEIPVMGHIGLTPQSATLLGGYKPQGRTAVKARHLLDAAKALEAANCCALVIEAVPPPVATRVTQSVAIPVIGIGAGRECDGQVLVWHDLLGISEDPVPRFVKRYADLSTEIRRAVGAYVDEVRSGAYPEDKHTYAMADDERERFDEMVSGK